MVLGVFTVPLMHVSLVWFVEYRVVVEHMVDRISRVRVAGDFAVPASN